MPKEIEKRIKALEADKDILEKRMEALESLKDSIEKNIEELNRKKDFNYPCMVKSAIGGAIVYATEPNDKSQDYFQGYTMDNEDAFFEKNVFSTTWVKEVFKEIEYEVVEKNRKESEEDGTSNLSTEG